MGMCSGGNDEFRQLAVVTWSAAALLRGHLKKTEARGTALGLALRSTDVMMLQATHGCKDTLR